VVAETEACNDRSLLKAQGRGTRSHNREHELSFASLLLLFLQISFVKLLSLSVIHINLRALLVTVSLLSYSCTLPLSSTFASRS